ncbi:MAG TPA: cytochrome c [Chitinophagaceae bacterium]|nr:cytochrome c [Chitinophagaceae bacterium]
MSKLIIFAILFVLYTLYSILVYTKGTDNAIAVSDTEQLKISKGKSLFQRYNCTACHQLYGLGGYLGPELTTAYSDKNRGEIYMKAFLKAGGQRMPDFNFNDEEIEAIISYLKYVDATAVTYKNQKTE